MLVSQTSVSRLAGDLRCLWSVLLPAGERALERGAERALERAGGQALLLSRLQTANAHWEDVQIRAARLALSLLKLLS
jgi:hypothetical protein